MPTPFRPRILSREQVRAVDRRAIEEFGLPGVVLMENAGRNAAFLLEVLEIRGLVAICCGKGNNAGDGFVVARYLANAGHAVKTLLAVPGDSLTGDAAIHYHVWKTSGGPSEELPTTADAWNAALCDADWIVDALLGTGTRGPLRDPFLTAVHAINAAHRRVLAIDLPSGLDCETGQILGACVQADHTATFVAAKPGFEVPEAAAWLGQVHVLDIGVPFQLLQDIASSPAVSSNPRLDAP